MSEEQIIYEEIIKLITENKLLSINGTPMALNEANNYITNLQQENKQLKEALLDIKKYIEKEKSSNLVKEEYETPGYLKYDILDIVNKVLGDKENE